MAKKIYVGNLSFSTTEETLQSLFLQYGEVLSARIIFDKETHESKGFGFVEMSDEQAASIAIATLNNKNLDGRRLRVKEAMERPKNSDRAPRSDRRFSDERKKPFEY